MHSRLMIAVLLGLVSTAAQAGPNQSVRLNATHLQVGYIRSTNVRYRATCAEPTAQKCRSTWWRRTRCGKLAMAAARVDRNAACNRALADDALAQVVLLNEREVLAPEIVSADGISRTASGLVGDDCNPAPGRTCATVTDYSHHGHYARGMHTTAFGSTIKGVAFEPTDNLTAEAANARFQRNLTRLVWSMNGNSVTSCHEYVYEKYFDYSLFEDETAQYGNDPRLVHVIAFSDVATRSSIGTRDVAGIALAQLDGTPFASSIAFPADQPKNVFFTTMMLATPPEAHDRVELPCLERDAVAFHSVHLNDDALMTVMQAGASTHDESFLWHRDMGLAMAAQGVIDEELYVLEDFRERYARLLARRHAVEGEFDAFLRLIDDKVRGRMFIENNPFPPPIDEIWDPFVAIMAPIDEIGLDILPAGGMMQPGFAYVPPMDFGSVDTIDINDETALAAGLTKLADNTCAFVAGTGSSTTLREFMIRLAYIDAQIEDMLHEAQDLGCLDAGNPQSPCDWSPRHFAQRVTDLYGAEREQDFKRCLDYTAGDFGRVGNRTFVVNGQPVPGCNLVDYSASPTALETYFACIDAWRQAAIAEIVAAQGSVLDPNTGLVRVGNSSAETFDLGTSMAGASLAYDVSWSVTGFEQHNQAEDPAALDARVSGLVILRGSLFGQSKELASADIKMTYQQADVDFFVAGREIYGVGPEQQFVPGVLHPVADSRAWNPTFIEASVVIPVLGIPVTVRGTVGGSAGLDYHAAAIKEAGVVNNQLVAGVTPYAGVTASASVSIDLLVIEAGVKGSITIVQLSLPFGAGVHISVPPGEQDVILAVQTRGDMQLSMLSGYLAVFGEIDLYLYSKSVEIPFFSWPGIVTSTNLYHSEYNVPLEPLFFVAYNGIP